MRAVSALAGSALLLAALPVAGPRPAAQAVAADTTSAGLTEGQKDLAAAQESGRRIEVVGERAERSTVFANPDGYTFTLEESAVPVRVKKADGGWQSPDPTLEVQADGSVAPKAAAVDMAFSGGGDTAPLVKIDDGGKSLQLGWPGKLPAPELDGPSALYPEVFPGVDLKVTASAEGFQHVLVVKTPQAAASEDLQRISYSMKASGLDVRTGQSGSLEAVDGDGKRVFRAPPAQMWDSAGARPAPTARTAAFSRAAETETTDGSAAPAVDSPVPGTEPAAGDTVSDVRVKLSDDALTVVPDADMLSGTDASAFPLYIDPTVTWSESERTLLRSDGYESYGWGNGDDGLGKGVGECGTWSGYYCGPGYVQRLYFEFSPASLKGKQVLGATFRVTEPWAFQCDPRWVDLVRTPDNISSSTTWASRPQGGWDTMVDRNVSAGRGSLCDADSPDAPIEFQDNAAETNENLTPTVRDFAAGKFSRLTLMIKAHDETDTGAWKRFKDDAVLSVDYVGLPAKPTGIGLVTGTGTVCETSESDPAIVSDPTPSLTSTPQTASGGESGAQLRVAMDVDKKAADGTWANAFTEMERPTTGYVGDNVKVTASAPTLTEGTLYRYRTWTRSYYAGGASQLPGPSNASTTGWCFFKVDPTAPKAPVITIGAPYLLCTSNDCQAKGGPGQKATFTFAPASGDANNTAYQYKLSGAAAWSAETSGAKVSQVITPQRSGTYTLYVRAKDVVGRWGAQGAVDFLVAAGDGPLARWHFAENSGAALDAETADGANDLTLQGGAARDDRGRRGLVTQDSQGVPLATPVTDKGLVLNGTTGYAAADGPVLETRSPYSVAAWVKLDPTTADGAILSGRDSVSSPFTFRYSQSYKTWYFGVRDPAQTDYYWGVSADSPAVTGVWTHVAATFDPGSGLVKLYVNGKQQTRTKTVQGSWPATGNLEVGRHEYSTGPGAYFKGSADEVAVWQRVLTPEEIADEARTLISQSNTAVELVADWSAGTSSGTALADTTSGYGRSLGLTGGAALDGETVVLDGDDDAATASAPVVDDIGSFTVTTSTEVDGAKLGTKPVGYAGQVLGQRTATGSSWGFWYEVRGSESVLDEETLEESTVAVGVWHFGRLDDDGTYSAVVSDEVALTDSPVRLTGVYDAQDQTISLYVGYNRNAEPRAFTAEAGSGEFAAGKGFTSSAWGHYLPERISEIRLWAGAMAGSDQISERVGD
ncbi:LamG-like jellyroll fold domain-containing protein [Streptomyces sp. NPDC008125]|uniref:LamG-like jellyroll fold domain-containing protein n=1 Tax=Streptomyces sp. NPDC008125 TaxID=3364811 RepID=UPI0036EF13AE